ncbi:MAG TPA: cupin domain-containing protein [Caulobacteraceae bacterium]
MLVHDLSPEALGRMVRSNLATATEEPPSPIGNFDFHGCICGIASFTGRPPWEYHIGDELLHILEGGSRLTVRQDGKDIVRTLNAGDLVIVPKGCWHSNNAPEGVTMLYLTPTEGSRHSWEDPG